MMTVLTNVDTCSMPFIVNFSMDTDETSPD